MKPQQKLKLIPERPGVYLFKDEFGGILYVGKAISLRRRVRSYFQRGLSSPRLGVLVSRIADIEWIVTESEAEAFLLESNLIKHHKPRYNIRFRDDKSYPYIKLTVNEEYPRVLLIRNPDRDGALYFGPFTDVKSARRSLKLIQRLFPLRRCKGKLKRRAAPCLNFYIKQCIAPCSNKLGPSQYAVLVRQVRMFLEGHYGALVRDLERAMHSAAASNRFEEAAKLRDAIHSIERMGQRQTVSLFPGHDADLLTIARERERICALVFVIREGKVVDRNHYSLRAFAEQEEGDILASFIEQYYANASFVPPRIAVPTVPSRKEEIASLLSLKCGRRVRIVVPRRDQERRLLKLAADNAVLLLRQDKAARSSQGLHQLGQFLHLPQEPTVIEGMDISNIMGTEAIGSLVVFRDGQPSTREYRTFSIKAVSGIDDTAMLRDVATRRYRRFLSANARLPNLVLVDGGRGQVRACFQALQELGLEHVPIVGLAKEFERVFRPGSSRPVPIPVDSAALHVLQRVRDEAHRLAHSRHVRRRVNKLICSDLEQIPGIGMHMRGVLLRRFGSTGQIAKASIEELMTVPGVGQKRAMLIHSYWN